MAVVSAMAVKADPERAGGSSGFLVGRTVRGRRCRRWEAAALSTLLVWSLIGAGPGHAQSQPPRSESEAARRLALVVGIDGYPKSPLQNARNDARAMVAAL